MPLSWNEIRQRAINFVAEWESTAPKAREEADAHDFQTDFLNIFGVTRRQVAFFEHRVNIGGQQDLFGEKTGGRRGYIDMFWKGRIMIEMKTPGKDKAKAFQQAKEYAENLPPDQLPQIILISDFMSFDYYNLDKDNELTQFELKDLPQKIEMFSLLAGFKEISFQAISPVDIKAAEHMGELYDALKENGYAEHDLEMYLVRLLFCLFADDSGIFLEKKIFYNYITNKTNIDGSDLASHLGLIFEMLNKPVEKRQTNRDEIFKKFPYVNGGLFEKTLSTAAFNSKMREILLDCCTLDWSEIKPEIFGAMFQSVKDKEKRRELGEHYTSETNILKIIKPLFLDELWEEFEGILKLTSFALRQQRLLEFHTKLRDLIFLDPACGCGNFLVVSYRELRLLEIEVLYEYMQAQQVMDIDLLIRVNVDQFYGIEIEEFPARIAQTALWLMDHIMNMKASTKFGRYFARIPLTASPTVVIGNALTIDWESIIAKDKLSYILGNPPFIGYAYQTKQQKEDVNLLTQNKNLDYVGMWYIKASQYIQHTKIHCAFVSTNSITQGEQVAALWGPLYGNYNININFGIPTFKWSNEAKGMAAVHCVIIGFSTEKMKHDLNPYLLKAPVIFLEKRSKPLCKAPEMVRGNEPTDGGNFLFNQNEYDEFISIEPMAKKFIKKFSMGEEFLYNIPRYCLWLVDVSPAELKKMPHVMNRIKKVEQMRLASKRNRTLELAKTPTLFERTNNPVNFLALPKVSSENRWYIPMGFLDGSTIIGDKLFFVPDATLYHFGILTSNIHMAWMRAVCGRLEMRYSYSNTIVYNNFPWPNPTEKQKSEIENLAQDILDTRSQFPDSCLADLYDPIAMPPNLVKAHQKLDKAVEAAYGRTFNSDSERVAYLFELYQKLSGELFVEEKKRGKGRKK